MAKRTGRVDAALAAASGAWIVSAGYELAVKNSPISFIFQLDVDGADSNHYQLRVNNTNQSVGLVQKILRVIADRWPAYAFEFKAGPGGDIIDVQ